MVTLSSLLLLLSVVFLTSIEKIYIKNLMTPFTVTAWPLAMISVGANVFAVQARFMPVTIRANLFIMLNLFILWLVGFLMNYRNRILVRTPINYSDIFYQFRSYIPVLYLISWSTIVYVLSYILNLLNQEGFIYFASQEYEDTIVVGLPAHLIQVAKVLFILLVIILWKEKKSFFFYITLTFLALIIIAIRVKYHFVWVILIIFFIKTLNKPVREQIRTILKITIAVTIIFLVNYLIMFYAFTSFSIYNQSMWSFIIGHFFNYIMSGLMLLDKWLNLAYSKPWYSLFIVPINFNNLVVGIPERLNAVDFVTPGFVNVAPLYNSNVGTSYGVYYLIGGFPLTIVMTILLALVSYYLYRKIFISPDPINIFLTAIFFVMGFFSFFVQFFTLLSLYEITLIFFVFISIFKFLNFVYRKNHLS